MMLPQLSKGKIHSDKDLPLLPIVEAMQMNTFLTNLYVYLA